MRGEQLCRHAVERAEAEVGDGAEQAGESQVLPRLLHHVDQEHAAARESQPDHCRRGGGEGEVRAEGRSPGQAQNRWQLAMHMAEERQNK